MGYGVFKVHRLMSYCSGQSKTQESYERLHRYERPIRIPI